MIDKKEIKILTTGQFWDAMCNPRFVRISKHQGVIGSELLLFTNVPPEEVEGFILSEVNSIIKPLCSKSEKSRFYRLYKTLKNQLIKYHI